MISSAPIFIGGLMRSGTTLLRAMLGQHQAIASGLETHWFDIDVTAGKGRGNESLEDHLKRMASYFNLDPTATIHAIGQVENAEELLDRFMSEFARKSGKPRWAEKTTGNVRYMDRILRHWPDARILHIIRDPKDVFASFKRSERYGGPADYGALWCDFFADTERFKADPNIGPALMTLRYEQLVHAPETTMRKVLEFVGEAWNPSVAQFEGKPEEHQRVKALTGHVSSTLLELSKPLSQSRIGLWSDVLSEAEIDVARQVATERGLGAVFRDIEAETIRILDEHEAA